MANFNREQYGKPSLTERQAPFTAQVGMWWLYFKWQWLRDAHGEQPGTPERPRGALPRARPGGRLRALEAGPTNRSGSSGRCVHGDVRAHLLHELQVRRVAGAGARRHRPARGARPRLLLHLELLDLGRVGGARARLGLGVRRRAARQRPRAARPRVRRHAPAAQLAARVAGAGPRLRAAARATGRRRRARTTRTRRRSRRTC